MLKMPIFPITAFLLVACANSPTDPTATPSDKITKAEAKRLACPEHILKGGASPEDCSCVEAQLYKLGQIPGAIQPNAVSAKSAIGSDKGKRDIAIGILRLEAFEHCGLFDPDHPVSKSL